MGKLKKSRIGIIGGAGVAATNLLNTRIEEYFTKNGAIRDCDYPEIITVQATQVPSRSMFLEGRGESFVPGYAAWAKALLRMGAGTLCMNCNTAHFAYDELAKIAKRHGADYINLVKSVVEKCKETLVRKALPKRVGIAASDGTVLADIYGKYFRELIPEVEIFYPDAEFQKLSTQGICNVKNASRFLPIDAPSRPKNLFRRTFRHLHLKMGGGMLVSGCTDIAVDFSPEDFEEMPVVCSLDVLKEQIIRTILNSKQ